MLCKCNLLSRYNQWTKKLKGLERTGSHTGERKRIKDDIGNDLRLEKVLDGTN
jgi:hypothetical protein